MKQAIIITAYKDFEQLKKLVARLEKDFYLYIHIDKKSKEIGEKELEELRHTFHCYVEKKYDINWGGMNHLRAIIDLMRKINRVNDIDYIHIISGQDWPTKTNKEIYDFINTDKKRIFVGTVPQEKYGNDIKNRYWYPWNMDKYNFKSNFGHLCIKLHCLFYKITHKKRRHIGEFDERKIYKGLIYCSIPKEVLNYVLNYIDNHPEFMEDLSTCHIPEEFFFQTILNNSKYKDYLQKTPLRFLVWEERDGKPAPAVLDERDYEKIIHSENLFMRKIEKKSDALVKMIEEKKL